MLRFEHVFQRHQSLLRHPSEFVDRPDQGAKLSQDSCWPRAIRVQPVVAFRGKEKVPTNARARLLADSSDSWGPSAVVLLYIGDEPPNRTVLARR